LFELIVVFIITQTTIINSNTLFS